MKFRKPYAWLLMPFVEAVKVVLLFLAFPFIMVAAVISIPFYYFYPEKGIAADDDALDDEPTNT